MEIDGADKPHASVQAGEGIINDDEKSSDSEESGGDEVDEEKVDPPEPVAKTTTRAGRTVKQTERFIETAMVASDYEIGLSQAEITYYEAMKDFPEGEFAPGEMACVGAGLGGGFTNTKELHVMKFDQAMAGADAEQWKEAVKDEHGRMEDHEVFIVVPRDEVPSGSKILTSTWACKKKASGTFRARLNARGYEQVDGEHYDEDSKFAPVVSGATIHIFLILMIMAGWYAELLDM
jgi:hypothetical protein